MLCAKLLYRDRQAPTLPAFISLKIEFEAQANPEQFVIIDIPCGQVLLTVKWPATDLEDWPDSFLAYPCDLYRRHLARH